jgi:hypothetical protein
LKFEEKGELLFRLKDNEVKRMDDEVFEAILNSSDGDYVFKAQMLADMKPAGW